MNPSEILKMDVVGGFMPLKSGLPNFLYILYLLLPYCICHNFKTNYL